jgi:3-oxoacyl-(acyl-carrier-protein) synthase
LKVDEVDEEGGRKRVCYRYTKRDGMVRGEKGGVLVVNRG